MTATQVLQTRESELIEIEAYRWCKFLALLKSRQTVPLSPKRPSNSFPPDPATGVFFLHASIK